MKYKACCILSTGAAEVTDAVGGFTVSQTTSESVASLAFMNASLARVNICFGADGEVRAYV